jgi:prepilin-type N-terminal cleavage/methylation domain-containing protein
MTLRRRTAFTLVELLTVMTIIAVLVALLIPAVMMAQSYARVAQCMNNQKQLGLAIIAYEGAKGHFPGYANNVGPSVVPPGPTRVSWAAVILPFIGRTDLWEGPSKTDGWRSGATTLNPSCRVRVSEFVCPTDANNFGSTVPALSYAVNLGPSLQGEVIDPTDSTTFHVGVFRGLCNDSSVTPHIVSATPISMSNIASPSRRPLLTDNPYLAVRTNHVWQLANRRWTTADAFHTTPANLTVTANQLGFVWPGVGLARDFGPIDFSSSPAELPLGTRTTPTNHSGISIVTFCDGHSEKLNDSALCGDYDFAPIQ